MSDLIQQALAGLPKLLPKRIVRYVRGVDYVDIEVTVGGTRVDYEDESGVHVRAEIRDYLIVPGELILSDVVIVPTEGDEIIDSNEGDTSTFQIMNSIEGIGWRYTDRYHTLLRVHTREVSES